MIHEYKTSFEDFKNAQRLCTQRNWRTQTVFRFVTYCLPVIGLAALSALFWDITVRHFQFIPAVGGVLAALAWFGLFIPLRRPFVIKKLYKQMVGQRTESSPLQFGLEGDSLISRIPGKSEGKFYRSAIMKFLEDDRVALFFVTKNKFIMVPKQAMPEQSWHELRAWLQAGEQE